MTFTLMTPADIKTKTVALAFVIKCFAPFLDHVLYIYHYQIWFKNNQAKVQVFLDFDSEVNSIILAYMAKIDLKI